KVLEQGGSQAVGDHLARPMLVALARDDLRVALPQRLLGRLVADADFEPGGDQHLEWLARVDRNCDAAPRAAIAGSERHCAADRIMRRLPGLDHLMRDHELGRLSPGGGGVWFRTLPWRADRRARPHSWN